MSNLTIVQQNFCKTETVFPPPWSNRNAAADDDGEEEEEEEGRRRKKKIFIYLFIYLLNIFFILGGPVTISILTWRPV